MVINYGTIAAQITQPATYGCRVHVHADYLNQHAENPNNTFPVNATGNPALTINAGFSATEPPLPIGMMMIGRDFEDANVLRLAHAYERLRNSSPAYTAVETRLRSAMI